VNLQQKSLQKGVSRALLNQYVIMTSGIADFDESMPDQGCQENRFNSAKARSDKPHRQSAEKIPCQAATITV
jgi:hypothetical protein